MTRKHLWIFLFILFVVAFALLSLFPLKGHDLFEVFQSRARNRDAAFTNIVETYRALQRTNSSRLYGNLKDAIGTNDIAKYFSNINIKGQRNPNNYVLNRLQRDSAGKIKLGLDLQGCTLFVVEMDTSKLGTNSDRGAALSQGIEVIRRRVDSLGVAEPVIQASGEDQIVVQLPGLSEADKERARELISKAAFLEFRMVHPDSQQLLANNIYEPGYEVLTQEVSSKEGGREVKEVHRYLVKKAPELTGKFLKRAYVTREQLSNKPQVAFEFNSEGGKIFGDITTEWAPKDMPGGGKR